MAINNVSFPILSFEQANPFLTGMSTAGDLFKQYYQNKQDQTKAKYAQPMTLADLQNRQALAQQNAAVAKYADPLQLAKLQEEQATAKYAEPMTYAQLLEQQEKPAFMKAQEASDYGSAARSNAEARYMPLDYAIRAANQARQGGRFGDAYQLSKMLSSLPKEPRDAWISQNADAYNDMLATMADKSLQQQENAPSQLVNSLLGQYFPGMITQSQPQQNISGKFRANLQQQNIAGKDQYSLKDAYGIAAINSQIPAQLKNRVNNARVLDEWLWNPDKKDEYVRRINNAIQFAGIKGRGARFASQWSNSNPEAMADYDWYKNQYIPLVKNNIRYMEGMGATDSQREEAERMVEAIDKIDSNPQRAKTSINRLVSTLTDMTDALYNAAEPAGQKGLYRRFYKTQPNKGDYLDQKPGSSQLPTNLSRYALAGSGMAAGSSQGTPMTYDKQLEYTAKKHGKTVEELKQMLGGKNAK